MTKSAPLPMPKNSVPIVAMAAAVFVQRLDDLLVELDETSIPPRDALRLMHYRRAADHIAEAATLIRSEHIS